MKQFDAVLLDFDGTFADTSPGLHASTNTAFRALGYPELTIEQFQKYIGPPLVSGFQEFAGMSPEEAEQALAVHREAYRREHLMKFEIYEGCLVFVKRLRAAGIKVGIASAKSTEFLVEILKKSGLADLFDAVSGAETITPDKAPIIAKALEELGIAPERCLMVGDRMFDVLGARALGMQSVGVLFGFGCREELEEAGATVLMESYDALSRYIFKA